MGSSVSDKFGSSVGSSVSEYVGTPVGERVSIFVVGTGDVGAVALGEGVIRVVVSWVLTG